jgi:hypothetical protein
MKMYHFGDPHDPQFASAMRIGTWSAAPGPGVCTECTATLQRRILPLIIEWEPGSDRIGDFTWPGFDDELVVNDRVRQMFEDLFDNLEFHPIEMTARSLVANGNGRRPKPFVKLPYDGPALWDAQPTSRCPLDLDRSGIRLSRVCNTCGYEFYDTPAFRDRHLVLDKSKWRGEDVFRTNVYPDWIFCTERVKTAVDQHRFTNVTFHLDGHIPD